MIKRIIAATAALLVGLLLLAGQYTAVSAASSGTLDPTFGNNGVTQTGFAGGVQAGTAIAMQPDGKLLVGGLVNAQAGVIRYMPDGSVDESFGQGGLTSLQGRGIRVIASGPSGKVAVIADTGLLELLNPDGSVDEGFGQGGSMSISYHGECCYFVSYLSIGADDKITFGAQGPFTAIGRLLPNGDFDPTFGDGGVMVTQFGDGYNIGMYTYASGINGGFVGAGYYTNEQGNRVEMAVARFLPTGAPDPAFGDGGVAAAPFGGMTFFTTAVAAEADGGIVVAGRTNSSGNYYLAGDLALARFTAAGLLDMTFGSAGLLPMPIGTNSAAQAIAVQPDGKILAAGYGTAPNAATNATSFLLTRFNPDGTLDSGFADNGIALTRFGGRSLAAGMVLAATGRIVLGGEARATARQQFALAGYNPDGSLDSSFGSGGKVVTPLSGSNDTLLKMVAQGDGKILAAGVSGDADHATSFALARYSPDGALDTSFGRGGKVLAALSDGVDTLPALAVQPDGKIVAGGDAAGNIALLRFTPEGSPDSSFGSAGQVNTLMFGTLAVVAITSDGKIIGAGASAPGCRAPAYCPAQALVMRFNPDGSVDSSFGQNGIALIPEAATTPMRSINALLLQPDNRILIAGSNFQSANSGAGCCDFSGDFAVVRLNVDGSIDSSFGNGGTVAQEFAQSSSNPVAVMSLQPDGKIVLAGVVADNLTLARYLPNGQLDPTFGSGVGATHQTLGFGHNITALLLPGDGSLVVGGSDNEGAYVSRFNIAGSFGSSSNPGRMKIAAAALATVNSMIAQGDKIVAGGVGYAAGDADFTLARYVAPVPPLPTPTSGPGCLFSDVCPGDYFFAPVQQLVGAGVLSGYGDNTFRPYSFTTRGQTAKIVVLAGGWPTNTSGGPHFSDVPADNPFYQYIETSYNRDVISGYGDGTFGWQRSTTRAQLAKIVALAAGWTDQPPLTATFSDVPSTNPFFAYIEAAYTHGAISGYDSGHGREFRPANPVTRGQIAKIVASALTANK